MERGTFIFKLWFKNGTYIEKEVSFDENTPQKEIKNLSKGIETLLSTANKAFKENISASLIINSLYVRVDELIAVDVVPIILESEDLK